MAWNMIGAAFAAAAPGIPSWSIGYQDGNDMGGLLAAILEPAGGFGKFLLVLIAVSVSSACALSIYSIGECTAYLGVASLTFFQSIVFFDHFLLVVSRPLILSFPLSSQLFYGYNAHFRSSASICLYFHFHSHVSEKK